METETAQQHTACRWLAGFQSSSLSWRSLLLLLFPYEQIWGKHRSLSETGPMRWPKQDWQHHGGLGDGHTEWRTSDRERHQKYHLSCLWLHGLQPTRLLCLWDFSGKNTEGIAIPFSRSSSQPGGQTHVCKSPALAGRFFTADPPGKPMLTLTCVT